MPEPRGTALRVLLVEDSEDDAELLLRTLRKAGYQIESLRVDSRAQMVEALEQRGWDIVISDYSMPGFSGIEALEVVLESGLDLPFIVVSGAIGEDVAVEVMRAGASDYLMKNNLRRLVPAVERELREADERRARRIAEQTLRYRAYHDALTGLPNRWLLLDRVTQAVALARREGRSAAILFIDVDRFKDINDTLGHLAGDQLLRAAAARLSELLREGDTLARLGGDDFGLLLADLHDGTEAEELAVRAMQVFDSPFALGDRQIHVSATIGVAIFPEHGADAESLLRHAEFAMYHAKTQGRHRIGFYTADAHAAAHERFHLEHDLRQAIQREGLEVYYQPQVELATRAIVGVEALTRWPHPRDGFIPPAKFIPVAEEAGLITDLGEWVLARAARDYRTWLDRGIAPPRFAVNLSMAQIHQVGLVEMVERTLGREGVSAGCLEVEITESSIMQDPDRVLEVVGGLRDLGARIAIDDFGIGYSSLAQLRRLPFDVLKIDQSFVRDLAVDFDDAAIVAAILAMAQNLNLQVIAEGVEGQAQESFLREHGCRYGQGFLYAHPLPADRLVDMLEAADRPSSEVGG